MTSIADSSAVLSLDRVLPQHQVLLALIKDRLQDPSRPSFKWLDLACGRGQILAHLDSVLSPDVREKIVYVGLDIEQQNIREAERLASRLLKNVRFEVCELHRFEQLLDAGDQFDAVTCTNTVHEISPAQLADTFVGCLCRTLMSGFLFLYDMESLPKIELGAIPWSGKEIEEIFREILISAGEPQYFPEASVWPHRSCKGWQMQLNKGYLSITDSVWVEKKDSLKQRATEVIVRLLRRKLLSTHQALETASRFGPETTEEANAIQALSYDFWAIVRALNGHLTLSSDC